MDRTYLYALLLLHEVDAVFVADKTDVVEELINRHNKMSNRIDSYIESPTSSERDIVTKSGQGRISRNISRWRQ